MKRDRIVYQTKLYIHMWTLCTHLYLIYNEETSVTSPCDWTDLEMGSSHRMELRHLHWNDEFK